MTEYLIENKFNVINLSQPAAGPWTLVESLHSFIKINKKIFDIQHVLFLQTDISREFKKFPDKTTWYTTLTLHDNIKRMYRNFYIYLNFIGKNSSTVINLIGGVTDLVMDYKNDFNYLNFLIPSWTQLIDPNAPTEFIVKTDNIPDYMGKNNKEEYIEMLDRSLNRLTLWNRNKEFFWPDGSHPNRHGHKILYDAVKTKLNL